MDAAHEMIALPDHPHFVRRLHEIDGLGDEQKLSRNAARPAARLRREGPMAVPHEIVLHLYAIGGPRREIGIVGVGQAFGAWFGWRASDRRNFSWEAHKIQSARRLPAVIRGREIRNGGALG